MYCNRLNHLILVFVIMRDSMFLANPQFVPLMYWSPKNKVESHHCVSEITKYILVDLTAVQKVFPEIV